jgi:hypothetical protein
MTITRTTCAGGCVSSQLQAKRDARDEEFTRPLDEDIPKMEPWLVVSLLALIPLATGVFLPRPIMRAALAVGMAVLIVGVAMFVLQIRRDRRRRVSGARD